MGTFKVIRDEVNVFGKGYFRFEVRKKVYEFNYDVAEDGVRADLCESNVYQFIVRILKKILRGRPDARRNIPFCILFYWDKFDFNKFCLKLKHHRILQEVCNIMTSRYK